jgi:hypothetical protein
VDRAELERWVKDGLITEEQKQQILAAAAEAPRAVAAEARRFDMATIAYYLGGLLIFFAYATLIGFQWREISDETRLAASVLSVVGMGGLGLYLRRLGFRLGGELLLLAASAAVPLTIHSIQMALGVWPNVLEEDFTYGDFVGQVTPSWVALDAASLAVVAVALVLLRVPLLALTTGALAYFLLLDGAVWLDVQIGGSTIWGNLESSLVGIGGVALALVGLIVDGRSQRNYSFWFYAAGLVGMLSALIDGADVASRNLAGFLFTLAGAVWIATAIYLQSLPGAAARRTNSLVFHLFGLGAIVIGLGSQAVAATDVIPLGLLYLAASLALLTLSVWMQRLLFTAAGGLAIFIYVAKLGFDTFGAPTGGPSLGFTFVLVAIGLVIILGTAAMRRFFLQRREARQP